MKKTILLVTLLLSNIVLSFAQDDMLSMLEKEAPKPKEYTTATFKGTRLINFHTLETSGKRTLNFIISHRFGTFNSGAYNFWGLDGGASIRLGLEYSYNGRLEFGFGRTSTEKMLDGFVKYRLLRQTTDNSMPLSVTLYSGTYYSTLQKLLSNGYDVYSNELRRMSYCSQIIVGRKFSDRFSLQLAPVFVYYNLAEKKSDKNYFIGLATAARYKFSRRAALTMEYCYRATTYTSIEYYNSLGIGIDIETGGHVFQMHFTNSFGLVESQFYGRTGTSWQNMGIRLGFNITRAFHI